MAKPVFFLAFAYDKVNALPGVVEELEALESILSDTGAIVLTRWKVTFDALERELQNHANEIRLFHFSGHADAEGIFLNSEKNDADKIHIGGLAGILGALCPNLKLVFLNGCSTKKQVEQITKHAIPTVIVTTKPLVDVYGLDFAKRFYRNFCRSRGNMNLKKSFTIAWYSFLAEHGEIHKDMIQIERRAGFEDEIENTDDPIYELHPMYADNEPLEFSEKLEDWMEIPEIVTATPGVEDEPKKKTVTQHTIQRLIASGKIEDALLELANHTDDATLLLSRLNSLKNQQRMGLISFSDGNQETNRISYAALELSKMLD